MYALSLVLGLEKNCIVALPCSGDKRNHGPRRLRFSKVFESREALNIGDSVIAVAIAGLLTRFCKAWIIN